jgi:hypothetical protein
MEEEKMAIVTVFKLTTMTTDKYKKVITDLESAGAGNPDGRLFHVAAVAEGGTIVVTDVWESPEKLEAFGSALFPVLHGAGVTPVAPEVKPVHGMIVGKQRSPIA